MSASGCVRCHASPAEGPRYCGPCVEALEELAREARAELEETRNPTREGLLRQSAELARRIAPLEEQLGELEAEIARLDELEARRRELEAQIAAEEAALGDPME